MKKNKLPFYPKIYTICTDGSTINTNYIYKKEDVYLNPDIKSNNIWLPELTDKELENLSDKSSKFENYDFNFESLIKKNS